MTRDGQPTSASPRPSGTCSRSWPATREASSAEAELLRELRGPDLDRESHYLRVYLAQLRRKLEPDPSRPRHLLTEPGVGYRLEP